MLIYQNDDVVDIKRMGIERESLLKGIKFKNKLITVFPEQGCKSTVLPGVPLAMFQTRQDSQGETH